MICHSFINNSKTVLYLLSDIFQTEIQIYYEGFNYYLYKAPNLLHHWLWTLESGVSKSYDLRIAYSYINHVWVKQVKNLIDVIKSS